MKERQFSRQAAQKLNGRFVWIASVDEDIATSEPAELMEFRDVLYRNTTRRVKFDALCGRQIGLGEYRFTGVLGVVDYLPA